MGSEITDGGIEEVEARIEITGLLRKYSSRYVQSSHAWGREELETRNREIITLWSEGYTLEEIGKEFKVTRERVRQIVESFLVYSRKKLEITVDV